ncbi:MAG: histidine ammonia-lyase [Chrysiogenia bacterium]
MAIKIDGDCLSLEQFDQVARGKKRVELSSATVAKIIKCRLVLEEFTHSDKPYYGINTGFGALAQRRIEKKDLKKLQKNLIKSHTAGVGPNLPADIVRGIMLLRANVLAKGYSGVRLEVVQLLLDLLNKNVVPLIPAKGSVGASGDLAPLSHLAMVLIGEGEVVYRNHEQSSATAFKKAGLSPLVLLEKEGLALINGTQVMTAIGIFNLHEAENLAKVADIAGAMTFEAQLGNPSPFYEEIQNVRRHPGQQESADNILHLIKDSPLWMSHQGKKKVQDAYSIRCIPQVHGAVRDTLKYVRRVLEIETNSATENPLIFPEQKIILSGGNFHGEPVAFAMDFLAIALTELGNISERRIDRLINPASNMGLPNFLIADNGLNSGFMIVHVTASALASENKSLAHPASVDNIPTSANQEDHVSMGTIGARQAREIVGNLTYILAIELMAAAQALDFYKLKSSPPLEHVKALIRKKVPFLNEDTRMDIHIRHIADLIQGGLLVAAAEKPGLQLQ